MSYAPSSRRIAGGGQDPPRSWDVLARRALPRRRTRRHALVLGLVGVLRFSDTIAEFGRFRSTSAAEVTFEEDGTYTIYYESESKIDGETVARRRILRPTEIMVTNEDGDLIRTTPVDVDDESIDEYGTQEVPIVESDYQGVAVREVRIPEPGRYRSRRPRTPTTST